MTPCPIAFWKQHRADAPCITGYTYAQFDALICRVCGSLGSISETILAFTPKNHPLDVALLFAAWRLGKAAFPLSHRHPPEALRMRVERTGAGWVELEKLDLSNEMERSEIELNHGALLIETSSARKIACHTLSSLFSSATKCIQALQLGTESIYCLNLPLFHIAAVATVLRSAISGAELVFPDRLERATHLSMVPTQLYRCLKEGTFPSHLKCLLLGGAPLSDTLYKQALEKNIPLYRSYGMTETASMIAYQPPGKEIAFLPEVEWKISGEGELYLRGPMLFSGYVGLPSRTGEEWFATGDLAEACPFRIIGRKDRQFISGGENIQPEEIEAALAELPSVIEARVEPQEDPEFGSRPRAKIYTIQEISIEQVRAHLEKRLAKYKIPKEIEFSKNPVSSKQTQLVQNPLR
jgi:acyl-CoA synthetase (AMP-forming)/AMP-acid ligase II